MRTSIVSALVAILAAGALPALAATYQVGPGRTYTQLSQVAPLVNPGDVVEVDGNATYNGVTWTRSGTPSQPITIRGTLGGAQRPVIDAGGAADAFRMDHDKGVNHYVIEDLVISNAVNRCVYLRGHDITLRRVLVHTCRDHGILGADTLTGDIRLTEVEVRGTGNQASPKSTHHPIYIATDQGEYPNAVLTIEKSWIHDNDSGNGIKSRAKTVKVLYNWIETTHAQNHTVELIGPDGPSGAPALCPVPNGANDAQLCNGEIIGNVLIARGNNANMVRLGSDGTGWSRGRYHVVNNTFVANGAFNSSSSAMIRAFGPIQSIELHNNIFWIQQGDTVGIRIVRDVEAEWESGSRRVTGRRNLVTGNASTYASGIPGSQIAGLTETIFTTTTAPLFVKLDAATLAAGTGIDLRLVANSVARNAGHAAGTSSPGYEIPDPTNLPALHPPRMRPDPGSFLATARPLATDGNGGAVSAISVGAFEFGSGPAAPAKLTLTVTGWGTGTVTSSPAGINCTTSCNADFAANTVVTLTANPGASRFAGWAGDCSGTGTCVVTMNGARNVSAMFVPPAEILVANPFGLDFGGQSMGTTSPPMTVTLTNVGTAQTRSVGAISTSAPFARAHDCAPTLAPGASCVVTVTFTAPPSGGPINGSEPQDGTLVIPSDQGVLPLPLSGVAERSLVKHYYRAILNRAPEPGGQAFWQGEASRLVALGANINEVWFVMANYFFNSPEYIAAGRTDAQFLADVYNTFFNRPPDPSGFNYWKGQMDQGLSREGVIFWFMFSPEFRAFTKGVFGDTAARPEVDLVMDLFRGILNRFPDTEAFNAFVGNLRAAQCQGAGAVYGAVNDMSYFFLFGSPEYANRGRSNTQFVSDMYNAFLRRGGTAGEVGFWINQLDTGARNRNRVRADFMASPEFGARVNAVVAAGCLP